MALRNVAVALLLRAVACGGTLLASSRLENCVDTGALSCRQQFVVTLTVQNGQNATEGVQTTSLRSAVDAQGNTFALLDTLDITLAKSQASAPAAARA